MAMRMSLTKEINEVLVKQLDTILPKVFAEFAKTPPQIRIVASMPLLILDYAQLYAPSHNAPRPSGRWHHQISCGKKELLYARAVPQGPAPDDWKVVEFFKSPVAGEIQSALERTEKEIHSGEASLVWVPTHHLYFLAVAEHGQQKVRLAASTLGKKHPGLSAIQDWKDIIPQLQRMNLAVGRRN